MGCGTSAQKLDAGKEAAKPSPAGEANGAASKVAPSPKPSPTPVSPMAQDEAGKEAASKDDPVVPCQPKDEAGKEVAGKNQEPQESAQQNKQSDYDGFGGVAADAEEGLAEVSKFDSCAGFGEDDHDATGGAHVGRHRSVFQADGYTSSEAVVKKKTTGQNKDDDVDGFGESDGEQSGGGENVGRHRSNGSFQPDGKSAAEDDVDGFGESDGEQCGGENVGRHRSNGSFQPDGKSAAEDDDGFGESDDEEGLGGMSVGRHRSNASFEADEKGAPVQAKKTDTSAKDKGKASSAADADVDGFGESDDEEGLGGISVGRHRSNAAFEADEKGAPVQAKKTEHSAEDKGKASSAADADVDGFGESDDEEGLGGMSVGRHRSNVPLEPK